MPSHSGFFVWINIRPSRALAGPRILPDSSYQDFEFLSGPWRALLSHRRFFSLDSIHFLELFITKLVYLT